MLEKQLNRDESELVFKDIMTGRVSGSFALPPKHGIVSNVVKAGEKECFLLMKRDRRDQHATLVAYPLDK